ncbi:MAG: 4'-phosphopantetheinyl transferase superfamily protein [Lachnospiraceae bacterium]|nr:4'-phosphopantetheinyl transferase superfamily protein [Lachnospiraceae bacterium]
MRIYAGNINRYSVDDLKALVSPNRWEHVKRFAFEADIKRGLLAAALLNYGLNRDFEFFTLDRNRDRKKASGDDNDRLTGVKVCKWIKYDEYMYLDDNKKPHLMIDGKELIFSLSHAGDYAVCAIAGLYEKGHDGIGIDIEVCERGNRKTDTDSIARHFYSEEEQSFVFADEDLKTENFYKIWTLKEAYMKATGLGLKLPTSDFTVRIKKDGHTAFFERNERDIESYVNQTSSAGQTDNKERDPEILTALEKTRGFRGRLFDDIDGYIISLCIPEIKNTDNDKIKVDIVEDLI